MKLLLKTIGTLTFSLTLLTMSGCTSHPHHAQKTATSGTTSHAHQGGMMQDMQQHMEKMDQMMKRMHQAKSPEEKQRLMDAHMQEMETHMAMMRKMMSQQGGKHGMGDMHQQCMGMMDGTMDNMSQMMDHMKQREQIRQSGPMTPAIPGSSLPAPEHDHDHTQGQ